MTRLKTSFANVTKKMYHFKTISFGENKECRVAFLCKIDHWEPSEADGPLMRCEMIKRIKTPQQLSCEISNIYCDVLRQIVI